jgi:predicted Rossmann fold flavoprotein
MTSEERRRIVVAGGGAAGYFGAITCAEADPTAEIFLCEATAHDLAKVRISGGGRCNVTHACADLRDFVQHYPRGSRELLGPLHRFGPAETIAWFAARGVTLKTEEDGRMFPTTDDSATIVECLHRAAEKAGVRCRLRCGVASVERSDGGEAAKSFWVTLQTGETIGADCVLIATGGTKGSAGLAIAESLGHTVSPPVPSLFSFHVDDTRLRGLEGVSALRVEAAVKGSPLSASGPVLVTHGGLSGPAILKLSAWGARELHAAAYEFTLVLNWADPRAPEQVRGELEAEKIAHGRRQVATANPFGLPSRLWGRLSAAAGLADATWATVSKESLRALTIQICAGEFLVKGKSMNKEEFVTCGGVQRAEVNFATMESRIRPGIYFAGEVLDLDGVTGGFNFQSAWTTGWHAGRAMAAKSMAS